jgi:glycosyltransferase involved in cell wall biosynthesis
MTAAAPRRDCILFSTADWHSPYWTNKQHTAQRLAARGWRVLYVETVGLRAPHLGSGRDWRRLWRRLWHGMRSLAAGPLDAGSGVHVLSPLSLPFGHGSRAVQALNQGLLRLTVRRFAQAQRFVRPVVWTYHPFMLGAVEGLAAGPLVYHCVDDLGAVPGVDGQAFAARERVLLQRCDAVFATSRPLERRCAAANANTHYMPNVVDAEHFATAFKAASLPGEIAAIPEPRIAYHGVLSDYKVDFALLHGLAEARPDWHLVLIGEEREGQASAALRALAARPNVHCIGWRAYGDLPACLAGMAVGLLPSLVNDYTRSMFPMKFYEYLAAGVPVVSTPLAFTLEPRDGLEVGADEAGFVAAVERQLRRGRLGVDAARAAVGDNVWEARLDKMLHILDAADHTAARPVTEARPGGRR